MAPDKTLLKKNDEKVLDNWKNKRQYSKSNYLEELHFWPEQFQRLYNQLL